jgi:hypothetical protein
MIRNLAAVAAATALLAHPAAGQSVLQRHDWRGGGIESYLLAPASPPPWLSLENKARRLNGELQGDFPIRQEILTSEPLVLSPDRLQARLSSNTLSDSPRI